MSLVSLQNRNSRGIIRQPPQSQTQNKQFDWSSFIGKHWLIGSIDHTSQKSDTLRGTIPLFLKSRLPALSFSLVLILTLCERSFKTGKTKSGETRRRQICVYLSLCASVCLSFRTLHGDQVGQRLRFVEFIFEVPQSRSIALPSKIWQTVEQLKRCQQNLIPDHHGYPVHTRFRG